MNALDELLRTLCKIGKPPLAVKCAAIGTSRYFAKNDADLILTNPVNPSGNSIFRRVAILKQNWADNESTRDAEWAKFAEDLQFEYDDGYGTQNLFGTVWFNDGSWLERGEYDGSEWWEYKSVPVIPEELKNNSLN